jgi:type I restriction-modification system DNA methylase subunit
MSLNEDFVNRICGALRKAVESASGVTLEGREREFRRTLTRYLFDDILGWENHSKIGEIYDIACFDDEDFPIIITETKWGVELTGEIREKLRNRIEELGSVKYGVFASERHFIVYEYADYKLREITGVNTAEAVGVAAGRYGLSEDGKRRILKLEILKRERLVSVESAHYFEKTYKEIPLVKGSWSRLLTDNLKEIVNDLTVVLTDFFNAYYERVNHYSGSFLRNTFDDWLRISMKGEEFKKGNDSEKKSITEVFCRETAYVVIGRVLFTRICEDKNIVETMLSGKGITESLEYYGRRQKEKLYLRLFNESREKITQYYRHLHELGFFDWWVVEDTRRGTLSSDDVRAQENLEKGLDYSIRKALRRLNRFDFSGVNRDILGDVYQGYLPLEERKRLGEFYTPREVIEYILDAVGYRTENEIRGKKLLDPACGSGGFLVEAIQRLTKRYLKIGFDFRSPDDAKQIIEECVDSVYGLDIHPFACFVAEINMLFQLVELYDVVKQKYRDYELPRIKIYTTDSLVPPGEPIGLAEFFENSRRKTLIGETKGGDRIKADIVDYVVGNPPYVNLANVIKRAFSLKLVETAEYYRMLLTRYKKKYKYKSAFWNFDIYFLFLEKGINWLKKGGKLGFICSNQFMTRYYGRDLRKFLLQNATVREIIDFGDSGVFKDVTNYPCILTLEKQTQLRPQFKCVRVYSAKSELLKDIRAHWTLDKYQDEYYELFAVSPDSLKPEGWMIAPLDEVNLIEKIGKATEERLDDFSTVTSGMRIGKDDLFIVQQKRMVNETLAEVIPMRYKKQKKAFVIERELLKPVLKGENVRRWKIQWEDLYVIFPFKVEDGRFVSIKEPMLKEEYPNAYRYFEAHRDDLENRSHWGKTAVEWHGVWYAIMVPGKPEYSKGVRLLTPALTDTSNFSLNTEEAFFVGGTAGIYGIILKDVELAFYALGILNSKMMEFILKQKTPVKSGSFYQFSRNALESIPMKLSHNESEKHVASRVTTLARQASTLSEQRQNLEKKIGTFPESYFEDGIKHDKLANIIKAQSISRDSYGLSDKYPRTDYLIRDLDGKETFRVILATGEYLDFGSEEPASYLLEVLRKSDRITRRELFDISVPQQPYLKTILGRHQKDKALVADIEKTVRDSEKQMDDLVYSLYELNRSEVRIIENYLKRA